MPNPPRSSCVVYTYVSHDDALVTYVRETLDRAKDNRGDGGRERLYPSREPWTTSFARTLSYTSDHLCRHSQQLHCGPEFRIGSSIAGRASRFVSALFRLSSAKLWCRNGSANVFQPNCRSVCFSCWLITDEIPENRETIFYYRPTGSLERKSLFTDPRDIRPIVESFDQHGAMK